MFGQKLSDILRAVAGSLETPVVLVLLVLIAAALALLGSLIVEFFTEHRHLKVCLPQLADELRAAKPGELAGCIERSGLLRRQKRALTELLNHPALTAICASRSPRQTTTTRRCGTLRQFEQTTYLD